MARTASSPAPAVAFARWLAAHEDDAAAVPMQAAFRQGAAADVISFRGGLPAPELFPLESMERAFARAIRHDGRAALQYGETEGVGELRALICERLARRAIRASPADLLVTSGSLQGLDVVGRVLLDPGDLVVTEGPTFMGALGSWASHSPRYRAVPVDADGMRLDALEAVIQAEGRAPKFVYALPTFQNPTGATLSLERRRGLLELAWKHGFYILEDDPYGELWFDQGAPPLPPIRSLPGAEGRVVYLGSFSKILAPGIRLGFVAAAPEMMRRLVTAKKGVDLQTDGLAQYGVLHLVRGDDFDLDAHVAGLRRVYREDRDAMLDALETTFPEGARWTRPAGGFFLWVELPAGRSALDLLPRAIAEGVSFLPGPAFFPGGGGESALRLSFSANPPERIRQGIQRLARAVARR